MPEHEHDFKEAFRWDGGLILVERCACGVFRKEMLMFGGRKDPGAEPTVVDESHSQYRKLLSFHLGLDNLASLVAWEHLEDKELGMRKNYGEYCANRDRNLKELRERWLPAVGEEKRAAA